MVRYQKTNQFVIIGTVMGFGYNCKDGQVQFFENSDNGLWNKVAIYLKKSNKDV